MALKFQYNKTSLQQLEKQLKVRKRTLPIIKSKESALRMEVRIFERLCPGSVETDCQTSKTQTQQVKSP